VLAHAGCVGAGLLTAVVSGEISSSASFEAVLAVILSVDIGANYPLVVKNYTGDWLNFGLAAER
jgi:dihydroxyacetone kinase